MKDVYTWYFEDLFNSIDTDNLITTLKKKIMQKIN